LISKKMAVATTPTIQATSATVILSIIFMLDPYLIELLMTLICEVLAMAE